MSLYDGDRTVGPLPDGLEAHFPDFGRKRIGADDEDRRSGFQLFLQQPRGALSAGDDVVGLGREAHRTQVLGDFGRSARGVVGHEQRPGADYGQSFDGARRGFMAAEDGAVEVEK
jgi:hypothetical protein